MGSLSIQKGKRAERAVANILNPIIERVCLKEGVDVTKLSRNLKQVQQGGFDLDGLDWIAPEIKHHKTPALNSWWDQTLRQAGTSRIPVLIWKQHGGQWRVRMRGQLPLCNGQAIRAIIDLPTIDQFLVWFELELTHRIRGAIAKGDPSAVAEVIGVEDQDGRPSASVEASAPDVAIHETNPGGLPSVEARFEAPAPRPPIFRPWERPE
jgi:hypothetical protein